MTSLSHFPVVLSMMCLLLSCSKTPAPEETGGKELVPVAPVSLDSVESPAPPFILRRPPVKPRYPLEKKKLKVLTLHSINSFFLYDGEEYGLEFELLQLYAKHIDMAVDIVTRSEEHTSELQSQSNLVCRL